MMFEVTSNNFRPSLPARDELEYPPPGANPTFRQVELTIWFSSFKYQYIQGNFNISQGNGSSDNLPENLV